MKKAVMSVLCAICAFLMAYFGIFGSLDKMFEDYYYHNPSEVSSKIRIIKIDDKTMNRYGVFSDWDREIYADLVNTLCVSEETKPAVIGFDILFSSEKGVDADRQFAKACEQHGNVVCAFSYSFTDALTTDEHGVLMNNVMSVEEKVEPYTDLKEVCNIGFANALMDNRDSIIRSAFLYFNETEELQTKSFSAAVYENYLHQIGEEINYPTDQNIMSFRYSGKPEDYENVSLCDVLDGSVPAETFDDCIVLVGVYAPGLLDAYFVPVDRGQQMYGVEIHANIIQALLEGKMLEAVPRWINGLIAAMVVVILILVFERMSVLQICILSITTILIKLITGYFLFNNGFTWDNLVIPVCVIIIAGYYTGRHYYRARKAKKAIESAFSKYVAPQVVSEIAKDDTYELKLGGEKREVAVLFVDIRGFTTLSESLQPEQVVEILNRYLELTTTCIFRHGGTLDKFIGDATMAVYNAPFDTEDYIYKAILTALDIVKGGNQIEEEFKERYGKTVGFGVGVNCGPAVVGNIGCEFRMDYTSIGDTVNTAARLESNAPKGTIYISKDVYEQVKDRIVAMEVGEIPLKGKQKGVFVYSVTGIKE